MQKLNDGNCLIICGVKLKFKDKIKILEKEIKLIKKELINSITNFNVHINENEHILQTQLKAQGSQLQNLQTLITSIDLENNKSLDMIKNYLINIKNINQVDFAYKNFENPQYEFLYNDLYKMFTVGEYYSMKNVYIKRIIPEKKKVKLVII